MVRQVLVLVGVLILFAAFWLHSEHGELNGQGEVLEEKTGIKEKESCTLRGLESFHPFHSQPTTAVITFFETLQRQSHESDDLQITYHGPSFPKDVCPKLIPIYHQILLTREQNLEQNPHIAQVEVNIIGGGTVGLIHALEAFESGATVRIVEKRTDYTRNIWFDLYGQPWFRSLDKLDFWGIHTLHLDIKYHGERAISIRAQILERYLSLLLFYLNVEMYYGYSFVDVLPASSTHEKAKTIIRSAEGHEIHLPFDIVVGADGSRSQVRSYLRINYEPLQAVNIGNSTVNVPPGTSQLAFVMRFSPNSSGECLEEAINPTTGENVLPWDIAFELPDSGAVQVYKRFFSNYCELQIFFNDKQGTRLAKLNDEGVIDWNLFLQIVNVCIQNPFESVDSLTSALKTRQSRTDSSSFEKDYDFVNVTIRKASKNVESFSSNRVFENESVDIDTAILLVGDAAVSSHFRLGLGINAAFDQLTPFGHLLLSLGSGGGFSQAIEQYERESALILDSVAQFEVLSIMYEAFCDYLVFIDPNEVESVLNGMIVFGKDYESKDYNQYAFSLPQLIENCPLLQINLNQ